MKEIRVPLASIALVVGLALIGDGIDGSTGAGIALVGSVAAGILGAAVIADRELMRAHPQPTRLTLRHRWLIAVDDRRRRRAVRRNERKRRKEAERKYLRRRAEGRERGRDAGR